MHIRIKSLKQSIIIASIPLALLVACAGPGEAKNQKMNVNKTNITQVEDQNKLTQQKHLERSTAKQVALEIPTIQQESVRLADFADAQNEISDERLSTTPKQHIMYFPSDIAKVDNMDYAALKQHADFLLDNPNIILNVNGHADSQGSEKYNMSLSRKRAQEVSKILLQYGVPNAQIIQVAHGETVPVADIDDWVANRRVDLEYANPVTVSTR